MTARKKGMNTPDVENVALLEDEAREAEMIAPP